MSKISFITILLFSAIQVIICFLEPENENPEQRLDIKIFGRKIKLNILEIKSDCRGKDDQLFETLKDKFALNRKKRAESGDNADGGSGDSDNSMMGSAQKVWNMAKKNVKSMADQAATAAKSVVDTMKNTFTG